MLSKYKGLVVLLFILFVLCLSVFVWQANLGSIQYKTAKLIPFFSPLLPLSLKPNTINQSPFTILSPLPLSADEIKKLKKVPALRKFRTPVVAQSLELSKKLEDAGNVLLYQTDPKDTTGRSVFVDAVNHIKADSGFGANFVKYEASVSGQKQVRNGMYREVGVFNPWVKTQRSHSVPREQKGTRFP